MTFDMTVSQGAKNLSFIRRRWWWLEQEGRSSRQDQVVNDNLQLAVGSRNRMRKDKWDELSH